MNFNEPSAELDLAVAKAVAVGYSIEDGLCIVLVDSGIEGAPLLSRFFRPSSDMDDAMEAAEKAFPGGWTLSSRPDIGRTQYAFFSHANPGTITGELTGPLAICALILESKEKP